MSLLSAGSISLDSAFKRRLIVICKKVLLFAKFWKCSNFWADALHSATMTKIIFSKKIIRLLCWFGIHWYGLQTKRSAKSFTQIRLKKRAKSEKLKIRIVFCQYFFWTFVNGQCNQFGISIKFWGQIGTFCKFYTSIWCSPAGICYLMQTDFPLG